MYMYIYIVYVRVYMFVMDSRDSTNHFMVGLLSFAERKITVKNMHEARIPRFMGAARILPVVELENRSRTREPEVGCRFDQ